MLYIVSTPIGNLEDITLRALRVLKEADVVLCEDTRKTKRLLDHYEIKTSMESFASNDMAKEGSRKLEGILSRLEEGEKVALVSEAGTPAISDPGSLLVAKVRERFGEEAEVYSVPGPSALTAAISISGLPITDFVFLGFLPHKKGREKLFTEIASSSRPFVFYESPHRIMKTLASLSEHLGDDRRIAVCREMTKIYEEVLCGTALEISKQLSDNTDKQKGEFVVIVS